MPDAITDFHGEHNYLSNFYPAQVEMDGMEYPTVEHAYQAAKTLDPARRRAVCEAETPSAAKELGRSYERRDDWFKVNLDIMESLVRQKFTRHSDLCEKLLATGNQELIEGNDWDDRYYGAVWDAEQSAWIGENHLGRMLMKVREELKHAK